MSHPDLERALRDLLPPDALRLDAAERIAYGYDNSRHRGQPAAVVLPTDDAQVLAVVQLCRRLRVPLVARGRGTNTTGASVPGDGAVALSFERMDRIVSIDPDNRVATVQPGVLNGALQDALRPHGLFWPPDPTSAPFSSIGGNLACNAGGPRTVKYGASRDNTLGLRAISGLGTRLHCGGPYTKLSSGYDLTRLIVGSEGTLALIVEADLRLVPLPPGTRGLRALYRDVASAARAVSRIMAQPHTPSALEFMDGDCIRLVRERGVDLPEAGALLMIEADGDEAALDAACAGIERAARGDGLLAFDAAPDAASRAALWAARKALSPALRSVAPGKINEDVVVPVSRLADLVAGLRTLSAQFALPILCFGHAGNGNLHVNLLFDPADPAQSARAEVCLDAVFARVLQLGGMPSGEHGIGLAKREFLARACPPDTRAAMRAIKSALDPDGILNPGKVLD